LVIRNYLGILNFSEKYVSNKNLIARIQVIVMTDVTLTLLGTNGWYSSKTGYTLSILIETSEYTIILDAGEGIHKIADIRDEIMSPAWLFLSHLHIDHISGLHTLARLPCRRGLTICVPHGTKDRIKGFIQKPYTIPLEEISYPITILELEPTFCMNDASLETISSPLLPFSVAAGWLLHTQPVLGYRFELGKTISFCTDTGPCDAAVTLARGADLLITECSNLPPIKEDESTTFAFHLDPEQAVALAKEAQVKQMVLVHFSAHLYKTKEMREEIVFNAVNTVNCPGLIIGQDDMVITL
jgi:ribonuclease BN (tRNA processing enzyme)